MSNWAWGWDAVAAIGQILGVIATFTAVVVVLWQNKPKVQLSIRLEKDEDESEYLYYLYITNSGLLPFTVEAAGLIFKNVQYTINEENVITPNMDRKIVDFPVKLEPHHTLKMQYHPDNLLVNVVSNKMKKMKFVYIYMTTSTGYTKRKKYMRYEELRQLLKKVTNCKATDAELDKAGAQFKDIFG